MTAEPGDRDDVQCAVEILVPAAVEAEPCSLPTTCFERGSAGEGGECCFAADATALGPADQELRCDYRPDSGLCE